MGESVVPPGRKEVPAQPGSPPPGSASSVVGPLGGAQAERATAACKRSSASDQALQRLEVPGE